MVVRDVVLERLYRQHGGRLLRSRKLLCRRVRACSPLAGGRVRLRFLLVSGFAGFRSLNFCGGWLRSFSVLLLHRLRQVRGGRPRLVPLLRLKILNRSIAFTWHLPQSLQFKLVAYDARDKLADRVHHHAFHVRFAYNVSRLPGEFDRPHIAGGLRVVESVHRAGLPYGYAMDGVALLEVVVIVFVIQPLISDRCNDI